MAISRPDRRKRRSFREAARLNRNGLFRLVRTLSPWVVGKLGAPIDAGEDGYTTALTATQPVVLSMLSRSLASQSLRCSLVASSSALHSTRQLPKYVRLNSSTARKPPPHVKPGAGRSKEAGVDPWVPPVLTYEQVKPKTEQPSPVRSPSPL